jgi:hypothetical protein
MSSTSSYSLACAMNSGMSMSDMEVPPAMYTCWRSAAAGSWEHSSPARSPVSSALRNHSMSAAMTARSPIAPIGTHWTVACRRRSRMSRVRNTLWPERMCPVSCPTTTRRLSWSSESTIPVVSTMNGLSMPIA